MDFISMEPKWNLIDSTPILIANVLLKWIEGTYEWQLM
jgi:hypothetical protein